MIVEFGMESKKLNDAMEYTNESESTCTGRQPSPQNTFQGNTTDVTKPDRCKTQTTDFSSYPEKGTVSPSREVLNRITAFNLRHQDKKTLQRSHSAVVEGSAGLRNIIVPMLQIQPVSPPPYSENKSNLSVEVTHYPLIANNASVMESNTNNVVRPSYLLQDHYAPTVVKTPPSQQAKVPIEKQAPCQCTCHHTHHHHHHHTIFINGKPVEHLPSNSATDSDIKGSPKVEVLKTSSCPAWADGSPRTNRQIGNYNTNNNSNLKEGANANGESSASNTETKYTPGTNFTNKTVSGVCETHPNTTYNNVYETVGDLNSSRIKKRNIRCQKMSNGMILLLVTLFVIIASLLSALTYFLLQGNTDTTDQSQTVQVPDVSIVLNQTAVCGQFPTEYMSAARRSHGVEVLVSRYPPRNDNRVDKQLGRILGGSPAHIKQYPWQGNKIVTTDTHSSTDVITVRQVDASMIEPRIFGGTKVTVEQYPWQVRLYAVNKLRIDIVRKTSLKRTQLSHYGFFSLVFYITASRVSLWVRNRGMTCGGSLIMSDWVLTAAHCTEKRGADLWTAYMGMSDTKNKEKDPAQHRKISLITQHPKYIDDWSFDYDISLMKLEYPVTFSPYVQPICIPSKSELFEDGRECYVSGWGAQEDSGQTKPPTYLQHAQVDIIGYDTCRRDDWLSDLVTDRMMCAGKHDGSKDACQGDSGGPLSCFSNTKKLWILAGSVSWGVECGLPKQPGVYTKIVYFVDWIWTNIGKKDGWIDSTDEVETTSKSTTMDIESST